jgi:hypothetical protein
MGKHCYHPGRKVLARRRRIMFLLQDLFLYSIALGGLFVVLYVMKVLLEGGF